MPYISRSIFIYNQINVNNDRKQANVEVLQKQQEEHKIRAQKIDKLKTAYAQYELGQIDNDQFKYICNKKYNFII